MIIEKTTEYREEIKVYLKSIESMLDLMMNKLSLCEGKPEDMLAIEEVIIFQAQMIEKKTHMLRTAKNPCRMA